MSIATARAARSGGAGTANRHRRRGPRSRSRLAGLGFVALPLAFYALVVLVPLAQSFQYSFYDWDGVSAATWVGFDNYLSFVNDPVLRSTLWHVLVLIFFFSILPIVIGLLSTALITRRHQPGMAVFRFLYFLPQVLTSVVVALVFKRIYGPDGALNTLLRAVGLDALTRSWLGDFKKWSN